ncbi:MAG: HEAT repeat domain-containing protein [Deltaproteobacteria bacterium]|nr:HEAT repeat domain-containing protein [Deltaproteobacteria bacterium]
MREEALPLETTLSLAEQAAARGDHVEAERHYRRLLQHSHVMDHEYEDWAGRLAELYLSLERPRDAGFVYVFLERFDRARAAFAQATLAGTDARVEQARCLGLDKRHAEAAAMLEAAARPVAAAIAWEEAKNPSRARDLWARVVGDPRLKERPYELALASFNLGMASLSLGADVHAAHRHLAVAQRLLEQVADEFETRGERERAFDCYQILIKLGKDSGSLENLSEGYLNCIRILKEDGLKFYALQYLEDYVQLAVDKGEKRAAATLLREAAEYSQRTNLPYHRHYLLRAAKAWEQAAERSLAMGMAAELAENATLASIDGWSALGDFGKVRDAYASLSTLDLPARKRERYKRIASRYVGAPSGAQHGPSFPDYLRKANAYGDIWFADLLEWELGGDPEQVSLSMVGDRRYPDAFRRRALNLLLLVADARVKGKDGAASTLTRTAELLGELSTYAALSPLERLYEHADETVRHAAVRALRFLYFKRSLALVGRALGDPAPKVREGAIGVIPMLHFPHAFQPLSRIFQEAKDERVKVAALTAIGKIETVEAGEWLIEVLRYGEPSLRAVAKQALGSHQTKDMLPILKRHLELESNPEVRRLLRDLVLRGGDEGRGG